MSPTGHMIYPIFLSSLCRELWDLRAKIYTEIGGEQFIYVDERIERRDTANQDDLEAKINNAVAEVLQERGAR